MKKHLLSDNTMTIVIYFHIILILYYQSKVPTYAPFSLYQKNYCKTIIVYTMPPQKILQNKKPPQKKKEKKKKKKDNDGVVLFTCVMIQYSCMSIMI